MSNQLDPLERYGCPTGLILAIIAVLIIGSLVMLGIEAVKDLVGR